MALRGRRKPRLDGLGGPSYGELALAGTSADGIVEDRSVTQDTQEARSTMSESDVLFSGKRFRVVHVHQQTPAGRTLRREIIRHPGAVAILPILEDGRVCLIENYRVAVDDTLLELPAGTIEPGEPPLETAARELTEETGYRAARVELLTTFFTSPGILDERMVLYLATGLSPGPTALEEGEQIVVRNTPWEEALAMARDGRIEDGKTLAGLLYYETFVRKRAD